MSADSETTAGWTMWDWPFFEDRHAVLAERSLAWARDMAADDNVGHDFDSYRRLVRSMGEHDLLQYVVPDDFSAVDVRSISLVRETLTYTDALYDALFTMQGIGTLAIQQHGTDAQKARYLDRCRKGEAVAALALTEPDGGSDVASTATTATRDGDGFVIDGAKTYISNAGFADHYIVIARTGEEPGARGLSAFIVDADTPNITVGEQIEFIADHPAASVTFDGCRVGADALVGTPGKGFKVAMGALDIFRPSVGAAAVGLSRRAIEATLDHVRNRQLFGSSMGNLQAVQMLIADNAVDLDNSALSVYRAAWVRDVRGDTGSYAASSAKYAATEAAGRIVDRCVQMMGGKGVTRGNLVEKLYREARPMRIYEGSSEVQKLIMARNILADKARP